MKKGIGSFIVVFSLIVSLLASYICPVFADEISSPDEFVKELAARLLQDDIDGAVDLIVNNPDTARLTFRTILAEIERQLSQGASPQDETLLTADKICGAIALVFKEKMGDDSLVKEYQAYSSRIQGKAATTPPVTTSPQTGMDARINDIEKNLFSVAGLTKNFENVTAGERNYYFKNREFIEKTIEELVQAKDYPRLVRICNILARYFDNVGHYQGSIEIRSNLIQKVLPQMSDSDLLLREHLRLANSYILNEDYNNGLKQLNAAEALIKNNNTDLAKLARFIIKGSYFYVNNQKMNISKMSESGSGFLDSFKEVGTISKDFAYEQEDFYLFLMTYRRFMEVFRQTSRQAVQAGNPAEAESLVSMCQNVTRTLIELFSNDAFFVNNDADKARAIISFRQEIINLDMEKLSWPSTLEEDQKLSAQILQNTENLAQGAKIPEDKWEREDLKIVTRMFLTFIKSTSIILDKHPEMAKDTKKVVETMGNFCVTLGVISLFNEDLIPLIQAFIYYTETMIKFSDLKDAKNRATIEEGLKNIYSICTGDFKYPAGEMEYYRLKGMYEEKKGNLKEAQAAYMKLIEMLEQKAIFAADSEQERLLILKQSAGIYEKTAGIMLKNGESQAAVELIERLKGNQFISSIDITEVKVKEPEAQQALQKASQLRSRAAEAENQLIKEQAKPRQAQNVERIKELTQTVASSKADFYKVVNTLRQTNPEYEKLVAVKPVRFARIKEQLPGDMVVVQYLPLPDKLYIFVVTKDTDYRIKTVNIGKEKLDGLVKNYRDTITTVINNYSRGVVPPAVDDWAKLSDPEIQRLMGCSQELYKYLIEPIAEDIAPKKVVAIIPTGYLYYLPFQALARDTGNGVKFFMEEKQIVYQYSADLDVLDRVKTVSLQGNFIAVGNPDGTLKNAEAETQQLKKTFPNAMVYIGSQATKDKVKQVPADTSILHLATHGVLNSKDVNESFIIMAGKGQEAKLKQGEIYALPLGNTSLVTLSACQTGLSDVTPGSEIYSLATAFSIAGASSIVATLWSISDNSTNILMASFYEELKNGKSKSEALQIAQMKLLKDPRYAHPFYWAPFILTGDWR